MKDLERAKNVRLTVLLVEHNMGLVMEICERLIVLHLGRKLAEGPPVAIKENPSVLLPIS